MLEIVESIRNGHLLRINVAKPSIDLVNGDVRPIHSILYQARQTARQFAVAGTDKMITEKMIEPTSTKRAVLNLFASKKDGSLRFFVDYRKLHAVMISDSYLLPLMDECIDSLKGKTVL